MSTIPEMLASAVQYHQAGNFPEAEKRYCDILQTNPFHAEALHLLGVLAHQIGRNEIAVDYIQRALRLRPDLAEAHHNLGVVYKAQKKVEEAVACHQEAIRLQPDYADAHNSLGVALKELGRFDEAKACYRRALELQPNLARPHSNLGNILMDQDRLEEAEVCYEKALKLEPHFSEAHNNLGNALQRQGKTTEALARYEEAIRLKPDYAEAHWNRSLGLLLVGRFEEGWREYEWRWKSKTFIERGFREPLWDGASFVGRTLLLHAEQGLGDTLHFIRYAPQVKARGGRVVFECTKALMPILAGFPGIDQFVALGSQLPSFDVQVPLLSLPGIFGMNLSYLPADIPYLSAKPHLIERWRQELSAYPGFKIGIAWQGSAANKGDRRRSIPLAQFAPLARVPGVHLFSLQKGLGTEQIREVADRFAVIDLGSRLDEVGGAFLDTAAVMKNLDLVITADTATGHVAGALGVPVWIALAFMADWRWLTDRSDSPWYPSARLFRQNRVGGWDDVFEEMAQALAQTCRARPAAVRVAVAPGELMDKITILQIKSARITDAAKLQNVHVELALLEKARASAMTASAELDALTAQLKTVNEQLWDIEDAIRECERADDFGPRFIELARAVYQTNDERAALKRRINELLGSTIVEEKSYTDYRDRSSLAV